MARISLGMNSTGKQVRKAVYGKTQKEARKKADELKRQYTLGLTNEKVGTVTEFLDSWISDDVKVTSGNKTIRGYEDTVRDYIKPFIGHYNLQKLTPSHCRQWQATLIEKKFTANMRKKSLTVFRVAVNAAIRMDMIHLSPLRGIPLPKVVRREINPLDPEQCKILFKHCAAHPLGDMIILATMTGLRKGELFALRWKDVNIAERVITVRRTLEEVGGSLKIKDTKTTYGRRAVLLEAIGGKAMESRVEKAIKSKTGPGNSELVFSNRKGEFLRGSNFDRSCWYKIRKASETPDTVRFHDLRHTHASQMLASQSHPKVIQERLGHGDVTITLNTYSHVMGGLQADSVERLNALFTAGEAVEKPVEEQESSGWT